MRKVDISAGDIFQTDSCGLVTVVEYNSCSDVVVKFADGTTTSVLLGNLRKGQIKNNNRPNVYGVGYVGYGKFKARGKGKLTKEYSAWHTMLQRCYDPAWQLRNPWYVGCSVSEKWLGFQNFAKWYSEQEHCDKGFHLDKDLTVVGNKIYGEQFCSLVPRKINNLVSGNNKGYFYCNTKKKYSACCGGIETMEWLGYFNTKEDAHAAYKLRKEFVVKEVAAMYKNVLSKTVYQNLMNYTVSIED